MRYNRKPPLIYKYCVNFMVAKDMRLGCCKGQVEGWCYAERQKVKIQRPQEELVEDSVEFGTLVPLGATSTGRIAWEM